MLKVWSRGNDPDNHMIITWCYIEFLAWLIVLKHDDDRNLNKWGARCTVGLIRGQISAGPSFGPACFARKQIWRRYFIDTLLLYCAEYYNCGVPHCPTASKRHKPLSYLCLYRFVYWRVMSSGHITPSPVGMCCHEISNLGNSGWCSVGTTTFARTLTEHWHPPGTWASSRSKN